jgi:tRNA uridine 5-carbamoylmethylation protein Kti12
MKLIFVYGPPAAGKLTVATELANMTGYKLVDNHKATDFLEEVFPRSDARLHPWRSKLGRKIRIDLVSAAAEADVNLIITFAPLSDGMFDFIRDITDAVATNGGELCMVQLLPSRDVLEARVLSESRKGVKIDTTKRWHELTDNNEGAFATFPGHEHLVLDNSVLTPQQAAQAIIGHYKL